jgi:hypothetical protein
MKVWFTYFFFSPKNGVWKIGKSGNIQGRQTQLWHIGRDGSMIAAFNSSFLPEEECHSVFYKFRLHGEWFSDCNEIRSFLDERKDSAVDLPAPYSPRKCASLSRRKTTALKKQTSISLAPDLISPACEAATQDGRTLSGWIEQLIKLKLA